MKSRLCLSTVLAGMLLALAQGAAAAQTGTAATTGAWGLQYGVDSDLHRLTVNYETPVWWSYQFSGSRLDLVGEFGVSYWRMHGGSDGPRSAWQASAIPMFQWWLTPRFFVEAGIGATVFSRTRIGEQNLGSAFQFGDHIGVGYQVNDNVRVNLRASHFSNAGIKEPNDGVNSFQLGMTMRW